MTDTTLELERMLMYVQGRLGDLECHRRVGVNGNCLDGWRTGKREPRADHALLLRETYEELIKSPA